MCFEVLGLHSLWLLTAPTRNHCREWRKQQHCRGGKLNGVSASGFKLELQLFYNFFNSLLQTYILYILTGGNGTRIHSGISYCMFQVCNSNFNTVRMKYLGVKSLQLYHTGFILRESSKCEEKDAGRTSVCFLGKNYLSQFQKQQWHPEPFQKAWWEQRMALTCTEEHLKKKERK